MWQSAKCRTKEGYSMHQNHLRQHCDRHLRKRLSHWESCSLLQNPHPQCCDHWRRKNLFRCTVILHTLAFLSMYKLHFRHIGLFSLHKLHFRHIFSTPIGLLNWPLKLQREHIFCAGHVWWVGVATVLTHKTTFNSMLALQESWWRCPKSFEV